MDSSKKTLCLYFQEGHCKFGNRCNQLHQLDYKEEHFTAKVCYQYQKGFCKFGKKCKYSHEKIQKAKKRHNREKKEEAKLDWTPPDTTQQQPQKQQNKEEIQVASLQKDLEQLSIEQQFLDLTKTTKGKQTMQANRQNIFQGLDLYEYLKDKQLNEKEREVMQIARKYMSTYQSLGQDCFSIGYSPSSSKNSLGIKELLIWQVDFFQVTINKNTCECTFKAMKYQEGEESEVKLSELFLAKLGVKCQNMMLHLGIFKGFNYFDAHLEEVVPKINQEIQSYLVWKQEEQLLLERLLKENKELSFKDRLSKVVQEMLIKKEGQQKYRTAWEIEKRIEYCKELIRQQRLKEESSSEEEEESQQENEQVQEEEVEEVLEQPQNKKVQVDVDQAVRNKYPISLNDQIYLNLLELKNIGTGKIDFLKLLVCCQFCKTEYKLNLVKEGELTGYLINNLCCQKCNPKGTNQVIVFRNSIFHQYSSQLGTFGAQGWLIRDVLQYRLVLQCESCDEEVKVREQLAQAGVPMRLKCAGCYQPMYFSTESNEIRAVNTLSTITKSAPQITKNKKIQQFKSGQPLPDDGKCKHYKHSFRYFRFACCAKAYPCDICHDMSEKDHKMEMAKTVICGFCSTEQRIPGDHVCSKCQGNMTKPKGGAHWEGGKGCRNKNIMSTKDNKKFEGTCKTMSKKAMAKK